MMSVDSCDTAQEAPGSYGTGGLQHALIAAQDRASWLNLEKLALEHRADQLAARVDQVEQSITFRLGTELIAAIRSPKALLGLPAALVDLFRTWRTRSGEPVLPEPAGINVPADFAWSSCPTPGLESAPLPESLERLRIVAVLDEFSYAVFSPECQLVPLPCRDFERVLDEFYPHLLLVESAWRGFEGQWRDRVYPLSAELCYLVDCCRRRGIRTVFWNKEDPSHFHRFLPAARLFDHVFTTDADCVAQYRNALGHERVGVLPFCFQPRLHNPLSIGPRRAAASFAGSWYAKYPKRSEAFDRIVKAVGAIMPVDIYDRNAGRGDPAFEFPERYRALVKGSLPFTEIHKAYKGYQFGITINTITSSPSMLARRIYELMASNTIVVSNPALALRNFGDLLLVPDQPGFEDRLARLRDDTEARHRLRLRALRQVFGSHSAAHRMSQIVSDVTGRICVAMEPCVTVIARARSQQDAARVLEAYARQVLPRKRLVMWVDPAICPTRTEGDVTFLAPGMSPSGDLGDWMAPMDPRDHYGSWYLVDLAHATLYAEEAAVGKAGRFKWDASLERPVRTGGGEYSPGAISVRCSILRTTAFDPQVVLDQADGGCRLAGLAMDEFNYCENGGGRRAEMVDVD